MHVLYLVSVWLHVLAATAWIGGTFFLVLVVVPWLRRGDRASAGRFLRETGERFRRVGWVCFGVLALTGSFNLWVRGVVLSDFARVEWVTSPLGRSVTWKLGVFAAVLGISVYHDFVVGPQACIALERDATSAETERLRRRASRLGRVTGGLSLVLVALAVTIVRGWP